MVKVDELSDTEIKLLEKCYECDDRHHFRQRCKGILLSNEGFSVSQIASILKKLKDTIYGWIASYKSKGIVGLENKKGQGVKAGLDGLSVEQQKRLKDLLDRESQSLKKVCGILSEEFGFGISKWMLVRYIKKNGITHGGGLGNG